MSYIFWLETVVFIADILYGLPLFILQYITTKNPFTFNQGGVPIGVDPDLDLMLVKTQIRIQPSRKMDLENQDLEGFSNRMQIRPKHPDSD